MQLIAVTMKHYAIQQSIALKIPVPKEPISVLTLNSGKKVKIILRLIRLNSFVILIQHLILVTNLLGILRQLKEGMNSQILRVNGLYQWYQQILN